MKINEYMNKIKGITDTLEKVIATNDKCNNCIYQKSNHTCLFGYPCITNNFSYYHSQKDIWIREFKDAFETLKAHNIKLFWKDTLINDFDDFNFI